MDFDTHTHRALVLAQRYGLSCDISMETVELPQRVAQPASETQRSRATSLASTDQRGS